MRELHTGFVVDFQETQEYVRIHMKICPFNVAEIFFVILSIHQIFPIRRVGIENEKVLVENEDILQLHQS